jgi:hypothetical protein
MQILVPYADGTLAAEGNGSCPICLTAPVAPRMTKCGHVSAMYFQLLSNLLNHR